METQAITVANGSVGTGSFIMRAIEDGEVLIKAEYTCISPGTELRCLAGGQNGSETGTFVPGYAMVGIVQESKDPSLSSGTRVYCAGSEYVGDYNRLWGGHCQWAVITADACLPIPDSVDPIEASLAALGAISYHGFTKSKPAKGEKTIVIGLGAIGQMAARLHAQAGADVLAVDLSESRVSMSNAAGVQAVLATREGGLKAATESVFPDGASLVVDSTGAAPVIAQGLELVADTPWDNNPEPNMRYMIQGSYAGSFSIDYDQAFMKQVSFLVPRNRQKQDHQAVIDLMAAGKLSVRDMVNKVVSPSEGQAAYDALKYPDTTPGTIVFDWSQV